MQEAESSSYFVETSRMTSKGQVTVPKNIREALGLSEGDRVAFARDPDGRIVLEKVGLITFRKLADELAKSFEEKGISEEEALQELERIREELWNERSRK
jgi:antitoxin PrlF